MSARASAASGLRHRDPAQRASGRSAVPRQAGVALRYALRRRASLPPRSPVAEFAPARSRAEGSPYDPGALRQAEPIKACRSRYRRRGMLGSRAAMADEPASWARLGVPARSAPPGRPKRPTLAAARHASLPPNCRTQPLSSRAAFSRRRARAALPHSIGERGSSTAVVRRLRGNGRARSSPASGAGARRSAPACTKCRFVPLRRRRFATRWSWR